MPRSSRKMREAIKAAAEAGAPNVIVMAGDRKGITDEQGLENCVVFLNNIKSLGRGPERDALHGAAQQQGQPSGLHVRPHRVGRRALQAGRIRRG